MKEFLPVIRSSQLFSGIAEEELEPMLSCLEARREAFPKDAFLLRVGDTAESVGIVLCGSIIIIQEDIWGNRNILSKAGQGQVYAAAFACAPGAVLNVSVVAETPVTVMLLNNTDLRTDLNGWDDGPQTDCKRDLVRNKSTGKNLLLKINTHRLPCIRGHLQEPHV